MLLIATKCHAKDNHWSSFHNSYAKRQKQKKKERKIVWGNKMTLTEQWLLWWRVNPRNVSPATFLRWHFDSKVYKLVWYTRLSFHFLPTMHQSFLLETKPFTEQRMQNNIFTNFRYYHPISDLRRKISPCSPVPFFVNYQIDN